VTIGLGIIGCGWAAGEIVRAAAGVPHVAIHVVCDTDPARAAALSERTGADVAADIDALLADTRIDAVYVGLPHALLAPTVARALAAKRHVLAEKPLALDPAEALRLGEVAEASRLKLAVFYELRRAGSVTEARRLLQAGAIGEPRLIRLRTIIDKRDDYWGPPGAPNWRARHTEAGGGVLLMNTVHQLDMLRHLTGLEFVSAVGDVATFHAPVEVEDAGSATLRLSNGGMVSLVASAHSPGAKHEETIEIDGTDGRLDLPDPYVGTAPLRLYRQAARSWSEIPVARVDSHALMLADFVTSVVDGLPAPAGAADAAAAIAAVHAIYRSADERRTVDL
jgi:predicted dehydrogenase